jgi:hypothetical protein
VVTGGNRHLLPTPSAQFPSPASPVIYSNYVRLDVIRACLGIVTVNSSSLSQILLFFQSSFSTARCDARLSEARNAPANTFRHAPTLLAFGIDNIINARTTWTTTMSSALMPTSWQLLLPRKPQLHVQQSLSVFNSQLPSESSNPPRNDSIALLPLPLRTAPKSFNQLPKQ